jgi:hypothetical protein
VLPPGGISHRKLKQVVFVIPLRWPDGTSAGELKQALVVRPRPPGDADS